MAKSFKKLISLAKELCEDYKEYKSYSGRGMFGDKSTVAFTTSEPPNTEDGKKLLAAGFAVDNLGMGYIYYTLD